jgi:hypothetical protein
VELSQDGVNDAETCRINVRFYLYKNGAFVRVINKQVSAFGSSWYILRTEREKNVRVLR